MVSQNPTVILQNSHNVQKELDGGKEQKEVLPFSFLFFFFFLKLRPFKGF